VKQCGRQVGSSCLLGTFVGSDAGLLCDELSWRLNAISHQCFCCCPCRLLPCQQSPSVAGQLLHLSVIRPLPTWRAAVALPFVHSGGRIGTETLFITLCKVSHHRFILAAWPCFYILLIAVVRDFSCFNLHTV